MLGRTLVSPNLGSRSAPQQAPLFALGVRCCASNAKPAFAFESEDFFAETRRPLNKASTINPAVFRDPDFSAVERTRLFEHAWTCVGHSTQLANQGDTIVRTVGTQPIIVCRDRKGNINAFKNVCRHRGNKLCDKSGRYPVFLCKYHRWSFGLDGRLLATPMFSPNDSDNLKKVFSTNHLADFDKKEFPLFPVRVETMGNLIFVNIDKQAPRLTTYFGDAHERLAEHRASLEPQGECVSVGSSTISVNANWKLIAENFMEYYHLPSVHPSLTTVSGVEEHVRAQGHGMYMGFNTDPLTSANTPIDPKVLPDFPTLTEESGNKGRAVFHHLFPNVFYFLLPHSIYSVCVLPDPSDPTKSIEYADLTVHRSSLEVEDSAKKIQAMWDFYDETNREDIEVCESVQQGLAVTEYKGGRFSYRFEETLHRFQNMVADYMTGQARIPPGDDTSPPGSCRAIDHNLCAANDNNAEHVGQAVAQS